jgi:hypothetical protein
MDMAKGWKPIPFSLKIVFVLSVLWVMGSFMAISGRFAEGLPLFGLYVYGFVAGFVVLLVDIVGPITFLYALWHRKSWGLVVAYSYLGVFVLNHVVALFIFREQLGLMPILIPSSVNLIFLVIVYSNKEYFKNTN